MTELIIFVYLFVVNDKNYYFCVFVTYKSYHERHYKKGNL